MLQIRYFIEYIGLRLALFLLNKLSLQSCEKMAIFFADFWYLFHGSRRRLAKKNILQSGIADNKQDAAKIARESYRQFAILIFEALKSKEIFNNKDWQKYIKMDLHPDSMALLKDTKQGIILVSGHLGNWEIAAQLLSFHKPLAGITKSLHNPYTNKLLQELKPKDGLRLTPMHGKDFRRLLAVLKDGEILALLIDQHAKGSASGRGMMIDFFGKPASTHTSPALLHLVTGAPLCFGYCIRTGLMSYTMKGLAPISFKPTGNREQDVKTILKKLTKQLENAIREHPEQYLWAHRRWR
ncbi:lysophospholipid acyltransferase family protein [Verrucomicrobiota bacterium]